jgi:hypothetical protein
MKISENNTINNELNFKHVSEEFVTKQINKLNVKKATGQSFTMLSFSHKTMLLFEFFVLPDKNGFIVG